MEVTDGDKHSSLVWNGIYNDRNKIYDAFSLEESQKLDLAQGDECQHKFD
jgi:hypothetical protein